MQNLNYLPIEVKDRRLKRTLLKVTIVTVVLTSALYGFNLLGVSKLESTLEDKQSKVAEIVSLEASINTELSKLQESATVVFSIGSNPLPLNQLLGTILVKTPKDLVVSTIFTHADGNEHVVGTDPKMNEEPTGTESVDPAQPLPPDPNVPQTTEPTQPVAGTENTEGVPEVTTPQPTENLTTELDEPTSVTIRGHALSLQSISHFASVLKNEPYVQRVDISPIENFDDGNFNNKIFEIVIFLRESR